MFLHVLLLALDGLAVHIFQRAKAQLDIRNQHVASAAGEVLPDDDTQHLQALGVWGHGVGGNDPAAGAQAVRQGKLIVVPVVLAALVGVGKAESDKGKAVATTLGHDDETHLLEDLGEEVGGAGQVVHDVAVATLAEADELVVLANDLRSALGEVEGERRLLCAKVVDVEDKLLGQVLGSAPDDPADTGVDETVLLMIRPVQVHMHMWQTLAISLPCGQKH